MTTPHQVRASLVALSRRHSRVAHEVEDVAHDLIASALARGMPLDERFMRMAHGAARRHTAFLARSAERRRAREAIDIQHVDEPEHDDEGAPLSVLSPALRTTLLLLLSGLEKPELLVALGLNDAALRKRLQALRELGPLARPTISIPRRTPVIAALRKSQVALLPPLTNVGARGQRMLAISDPDGHGLIFAQALTTDEGTATTDVPVADGGPSPQGMRC